MAVGEANYENCNRQIGLAAARMAETRAKSRALAHALNLDANVDFEMADPHDPGASAIPNSVNRSTRSNQSSNASTSASPNPVSYPPQNVPNGWACEVCGDQLKDSVTKDGRTFTAGEKASWSVRDLGAILCFTHAKEEKEKRVA
jgi:hypothetical protein